MKFYGHWFHATLDAVFTGLAQVAGALGNGPQQALGKEVELQRLKRRASPTVEPNLEDGASLVSKKVLVDTTLGEESPLEKVVVVEKTSKEKPLKAFKHPVKENLFNDKDPIEESFSQVFPSAKHSGMQIGFSEELSGLSQELPGFSQGLSQDPPLLSDSHSGFSQSPGHSKSLNQAALCKGASHKKSLKGGMHSGVSGKGEKDDAHKSKQSPLKSSSHSSPKSCSGSSPKSSTQSSHKFSSQNVKNSKLSQELSIPHVGSSQMMFSQTSDSQGLNTQESNTQGSNTQRSYTSQRFNTQNSITNKSNTNNSHRSNKQESSTQMSSTKVSGSQSSVVFDSQAYRIPRLQSELGEDELARKTAFLMGSFAKSVMEGGAVMLREYLQAANKGNNSG